MHADAADHRRVLVLTAALLPVLLAWNNLLVHRLPGRPGSYVVANVAAAAVLLAAARASGLSWAELGLARRRLAAGARWGGACAAVVAAGYATALAVPALRPLLADGRVARLDGAELAVAALVRIPLGTVLWEEVAFRAVLLAALARLLPRAAAIGVSAAVFGLWHVRPTLGALAANDLADGPAARAVAVLLACLATAAAGVLFAVLRERSGSLLAPALLHLATNTLGLLVAAAAHD
ncbi:type II CAAX prenyl endopeptidase Rce1 family protein [Geodermatophilus sp. DSM 44513]|uniref:CPBP family glutamic-type intramembrane protease n=1 Tax=Geodermatophilus sp. DSM 44513 TaxID=1528104 RepID=UPI0028F6FF7C|nr:CPBP family glutamic-type intramembrane protease [Geodermatophilus sp. DSM 44513]WNV73663.1 CPBP family glutamic-type intramembrane protease [Geodermatophilus sp. DSM 44513]